MSDVTEQLEIITCSYRPDLQRCRRLCESIDRFVPRSVFHTLIVPQRDLGVFSGLANGRRRVLAVQDVVPGSYRQLPVSEKLWMDSRGWPVRGWVMQQLVKLSVTRATASELIMFADSDLQFVRPFSLDRVYLDGKLRLHRLPGAMDEGRHCHWHRRAGKLLSRSEDYAGSDYVGQLITWRRSNLKALQQHIESNTRKPWHIAVARSLDISEYILYGSFVEHVLGESANGHFYDTNELCHCCWFDFQAEALLAGHSELSSKAIALLVQSNIGLDRNAESAVLQAAMAGARG